MRKSIRTTGMAAAAASMLALTACGGAEDETPPEPSETAAASPEPTESSPTAAEPSSMPAEHGSGGMADHEHDPDGGPPPEGIRTAADPAYPVDAQVTPTADHMPGMAGSEATVTGAFDTTAYSVTYTPTDGGEPVVDHKWVVHEELEDPGEAPLPEGAEVVLDADHMAGMDGATATIESSTQETVYMVDVVMDGMEMTDHKWFVESELQPAE
ncbi:YdhK family protein [Kocuria palustris]|uniref:YdhK family protein n=1 Tax=Kocuria palustris TaxID=71999 RepID=UPI0011A46365|nr:YdhK family protein [Kocuria palustris]